MKNFKNILDVLNFAIEYELKAFNFYTKLANQSKNHEMRDVFLRYAADGMRHKMQLDKLKKREDFLQEDQIEVTGLEMNNYIVNNIYSRDINYEQALELALKREKAVYKLYTDLATKVKNEELKEILNALAKDDANHKIHLEVEYEDFKQN